MPYELPLMLSVVDDELMGATNQLDPIGSLAIWTVRGRELVPHLTAQTSKVRGFQILVEAFRLWDEYSREYAEPDHRLDDFFVLIEQAFARTVGWYDNSWDLPGARRVRKTHGEIPQISLRDRTRHLLNNQKGSGLWGLYKGAAQRAGLLTEEMTHLSDDTLANAKLNRSKSASKLLEIVQRAMEGSTETLALKRNSQLTKDLFDTFNGLPLRSHLRERLIESDELTRELALRLADCDQINHRELLGGLAQMLPSHRKTLRNAIRCEDILAVVDAIFVKLCASDGKRIEEIELGVDLSHFREALEAFENSGLYGKGSSAQYHKRYLETIDPSSEVTLMRSVLDIHRFVVEGRSQSAWVSEEAGRLLSDVGFHAPDDEELKVGFAWRNDYYLRPLQAIAKELEESRD